MFKQLQILHLVLVAGVSLLLVIFHFTIYPIDLSDLSIMDWTSLPALVVAISCIICSYVVFYKRLALIRERGQEPTDEDLRAIYVLRWVLLEGAALLNMVFYFFLDNQAILAAAAMLCLLVLYFSRPRMAH